MCKFLRFNLYFCHVYRWIFFLQHQDKWILRHDKILGSFLLLRYLKGLAYNSVAELRYKKELTIN